LKYQHSTTIEPYFAAIIEKDLPNTKRFYKWNRKQLKNVSPFCLSEVLVKKLGYSPLQAMTILTIELWWGG